ncbi:MAG: BMC domain-containing protein [Synergistaceae bacterium]|jgi:microcompartment protein CcmL/EutN|nr:BMC domain-containing protein [Synergistaceae bacterium]
MVDSIGFLEFSSIAKGIEAADAVLKTAKVDLIFSYPTCPGKYSVMFSGDIAAVTSSLDEGLRIGDTFVIDSVVIPRINPQVINAIGPSDVPSDVNAIGVMEFFSITAAIYAADAAVKGADVDLIEVRLGTGIGGKSFVVLTGDVAAVTESVRCGVNAEGGNGLLVSSVVIPHPIPELFEALL